MSEHSLPDIGRQKKRGNDEEQENEKRVGAAEACTVDAFDGGEIWTAWQVVF